MRKRKRSTNRPQRVKHNWAAGLELTRTALCAFFIFTLPLLYSVYNTDMSVTKYAYALLMISLLYVLWGVQAWLDKEHDVCLPALFWPSLLLIAAGALSALNATNVAVTLQSLITLLYFGLFYVYVANAVHSKQQLLLYLGVSMMAALCVGVYTVLQFYGGVPGGTGLRLIASLGNPNAVAEYLDSLLLAGSILFLGRTVYWVKPVWFIALASGLVALYLAGSTGAWLGLLTGLGALLVGHFYFRHRTHSSLKAARLTTMLVAFAVSASFIAVGVHNTSTGPLHEASSAHTASLLPSPQPFWQPLAKLWQGNSGDQRQFFWLIGYEMLKSNPLFGIGLGHYAVRFLDFSAPLVHTDLGQRVMQPFLSTEPNDNSIHNIRAGRAHNDYVQVAAEMGVLGILALLSLLVTLVWSVIAQLRGATSAQRRLRILLLYAGVAALATDALVNFPMHLPASSLNATLLLGLVHSRHLRPRSHVLKLHGTALRLTVLVIVSLSVTVSAFDVRDWSGNVHLEWGKVYMDNALYRLAQDEFERSLPLSWQPGETLYYLGVLNVSNHPQRATAYFERSLDSFVFEDTLWRLANLYFQAQQYERARRELKRLSAMLIEPTLYGQTRYLTALVDIRTGHVEEAIALAQTSLKADPDLGDMYLVLGEAALAQKAYGRAFQAYQKALTFITTEIANLEHLSQQEGPQAYADSLDKRTRQHDEIVKLLDQLSNSGG